VFSHSSDDFEELIGVQKDFVFAFISDYDSHRRTLKKSHFHFSSMLEVLIFLIWLRQYPVGIFLASIFGSTKQTILNVTNRLQDWFYDYMKDRVNWKNYEWRLANSITLLGIIYTFILDGFEQEVGNPKNATDNIKLFSGKKGKHTVNTLLFVAASAQSKRILFFSNTVGGSMNDPALTISSTKDWISKVVEQERGLGDSIFENLGELPIDRIPEKNSPCYSEFCGARFIVENVIAELRDWKVLKYPIRSSLRNPKALMEHYNKQCYIVGALVNDFRSQKK